MSGVAVRTALFDDHVALGANIVDFHGFELPIWYSSITEEHIAFRTGSGLFDVSHMGFFRFSGSGLLPWLESLATQKVSAISNGRCAYTNFLDENGHIIDDMIFAVTDDAEIELTGCNEWTVTSEPVILGVPNASMVEVMWDHFHEYLPSDGSVKIENLSAATSILALQGPNAPAILADILGPDNIIGRFRGQAIRENDLGITGWIQGTGYTGESGAEIFIPNDQASVLWQAIINCDPSHGLVPVGLGARDTLRLEKGYLLSGQDFLWPKLGSAEGDIPSDFLARNTWETNVPFGLNLEHDFMGKSAVLLSKENNSSRWWGIKYIAKGPLPRPGKAVARYCQDVDASNCQVIGYVTSGGPSPSLGRVGIGMAYLEGVSEGDKVLVVASPRKLVEAVVISPPFV